MYVCMLRAMHVWTVLCMYGCVFTARLTDVVVFAELIALLELLADQLYSWTRQAGNFYQWSRCRVQVQNLFGFSFRWATQRAVCALWALNWQCIMYRHILWYKHTHVCTFVCSHLCTIYTANYSFGCIEGRILCMAECNYLKPFRIISTNHMLLSALEERYSISKKCIQIDKIFDISTIPPQKRLKISDLYVLG